MASIPDVNALLKKTLSDNGVGVEDYTSQIHALKYKFPLYLRPGNPIGIVMHNTSGLVALPNLVGTWKSKEPKPPPSHLAIDQSGRVGRYVRLQYADRATENTNRHLSIEFQAVANGDITEQQIRSGALIAAFAHVVYGMDLVVSQSRTAKGLAHHSLFVDKSNPDGHFNCPGAAILARKDAILEKAREFAGKLAFEEEPAGRWQVQVDQWTWIYTFDANGNVTWLDPYNKQTGRGSWRINAGKLSFAWTNSQTKESWDLPLKPTAQTGVCTMDGKTYDVTAVRL
jgi:hypothetical protein